MRVHFNANSGQPKLTIVLDSGSTIVQERHPETRELVNEDNYLDVARACVTPNDWQSYLKRKGFDFAGVMCSATARDQVGVSMLAGTLALTGATGFAETIFYFENGNSLKLTQANVTAFVAAWWEFRTSFFKA